MTTNLRVDFDQVRIDHSFIRGKSDMNDIIINLHVFKNVSTPSIVFFATKSISRNIYYVHYLVDF